MELDPWHACHLPTLIESFRFWYTGGMWPFDRRQRGFVPGDRGSLVELLQARCQRLTRTLDWSLESNRQQILHAHKEIVEAALDRTLADALTLRTIELEEVVANMRLVRLTLLDRLVLSSIGNLLVDCGVRKGRSIDEAIPPLEIEELTGKATLYLRYSRGKL